MHEALSLNASITKQTNKQTHLLYEALKCVKLSLVAQESLYMLILWPKVVTMDNMRLTSKVPVLWQEKCKTDLEEIIESLPILI
jgi:hypothetical protein